MPFQSSDQGSRLDGSWYQRERGDAEFHSLDGRLRMRFVQRAQKIADGLRRTRVPSREPHAKGRFDP